MKTPRIFKYSATGNDFLVIDLREGVTLSMAKRTRLAKSLCRRRFGIGADGLVLLEDTKDLDFKWDFYNSDGSHAEMCGNAARCVALHAFRTEKKSFLRFQTLAGAIETQTQNSESIDVTMPKVGSGKWNQLAPLGSDQIHYDFVNTGVPHAVVRIPNFKNKNELKKWAIELKAQPTFAPAGTNVTFVRVLSEDRAQSMTFERGVENFTLSCGTGAVAAAFALLRGEEGREIEIQVPGGRLHVIFKKGRAHLIGPAQFIGEIAVNPDFFGDNK